MGGKLQTALRMLYLCNVTGQKQGERETLPDPPCEGGKLNSKNRKSKNQKLWQSN